mmetsp:Transcript_53720/g.166812  ORF Transcript_53720/g.166812 Transcript_53720/m.166812 type:complete len:495 (+) Transcript_53720:327-1811(+)
MSGGVTLLVTPAAAGTPTLEERGRPGEVAPATGEPRKDRAPEVSTCRRGLPGLWFVRAEAPFVLSAISAQTNLPNSAGPCAPATCSPSCDPPGWGGSSTSCSGATVTDDIVLSCDITRPLASALPRGGEPSRLARTRACRDRSCESSAAAASQDLRVLPRPAPTSPPTTGSEPRLECRDSVLGRASSMPSAGPRVVTLEPVGLSSGCKSPGPAPLSTFARGSTAASAAAAAPPRATAGAGMRRSVGGRVVSSALEVVIKGLKLWPASEPRSCATQLRVRTEASGGTAEDTELPAAVVAEATALQPMPSDVGTGLVPAPGVAECTALPLTPSEVGVGLVPAALRFHPLSSAAELQSNLLRLDSPSSDATRGPRSEASSRPTRALRSPMACRSSAARFASNRSRRASEEARRTASSLTRVETSASPLPGPRAPPSIAFSENSDKFVSSSVKRLCARSIVSVAALATSSANRPVLAKARQRSLRSSANRWESCSTSA